MIENAIKDTNDNELLMLYREDDEDAKNILYCKYKFIIDILIKKYSYYIKILNIDYQEIYSECTVGFSDALRCYQDDKQTSLATFITLCIERKIRGMIRKYSREKHKEIQDAYSLDFEYDENGFNLLDSLSDEGHFDPLNSMTDRERYEELVSNIKSKLAKKEYNVFCLMIKGLNYQEIAKILNETPKQVDNAMQRIKNKVKLIINDVVK